MVDLQRHSRFYALITSFVLLSTLTEGRRQQVKRHADHEAVVIPGWTVPLEGVETCTTSGYCRSMTSLTNEHVLMSLQARMRFQHLHQQVS